MFRNKVVWITGAASGIGLLSGQCFAREGAKIALTDIDPQALERAAASITGEGGEVIGIPVDVTKYEQVEAARDRIVEAFGTIDILIPCAGGAETRLLKEKQEFKDQDISVFDFGIDLNLKGAVYAAHAALKQMAEQRSGVIIFLGSISGVEGSPFNIGYSASKSALINGVTPSIAQYGSRYNVRACCVSPGPVLTRETMASMSTLMGRAAEPQEIVDLILYLASDKAAFITGTNILIDGGRNIMAKRRYEKNG